MITIAEFFKLNQSIIFFLYGLVFFIMGFAIILQTRKSSRLELARSLRWLALFGITHAFHEWGDLFIPIQESYLGVELVRVLYVIHLILLAVSYVFLFEFGLALSSQTKQTERLHPLTLILFIGWSVALFILLSTNGNDHSWRHTANALARYFIGFPGGLLAAYGLRRHTLLRIKPLNVPNIVLNLQIAGISLGVYAIFGGLIPPAVNFIPGNLINHDTFTNLLGIPPLVFRSLTGLIVVITLIRALEIFDVETERRIEELEQHQIITAERERLARELHDGAIQKVYTAGLLVESASRLADSTTEIGRRLDQSVTVLNDSILDLRRNLKELHSDSPTETESLPTLFQQMAENPHYTSMVHITLDIQELNRKSLSALRSGHVFSVVNEALSNTVRHAGAKNVEISARDLETHLQIRIKDDGSGISPDSKAGYGLRNMRDRARLLNGEIEFANKKGTLVTLTIPWTDQ